MPESSPSPFLRPILGICLALLCLLGLIFTDGDLRRAHEVTSHKRKQSQTYFLPAPAVLRTLTLGYTEFAADLLWIRAIAYFADHLAGDRDLRHMGRYIATTEALDPRRQHLYTYGAAMLTAVPRGNRPVQEAIALIKRGHRLFPQNHRLPLRIGIYYLQELRTPDKEQRRRWRMEGADWIHRAILLGAPQPWLASLATQAYDQEGHRQMAIHRLKELYTIAKDAKARRHIAHKLRGLKAQGLAQRLGKKQRKLAAERKAAGLGYVSEDLFTLLRLDP